MSCACVLHKCMSECFSEIIVLVSAGRVVIAGIMKQWVVRLGGVQEHGAVALKDRVVVAAAAVVAVVIYYHDCWRDACFLTWEHSLYFAFQTGSYTSKAPFVPTGLVFMRTYLILTVCSSTAVGYIVDVKQKTLHCFFTDWLYTAFIPKNMVRMCFFLSSDSSFWFMEWLNEKSKIPSGKTFNMSTRWIWPYAITQYIF